MCLDFFEKITKLDNKHYIQSLILYYSSPVLAEVKPSVTLSFKNYSKNSCKNWNKFGTSFVSTLGLEYLTLRKNDKYTILLLYNKFLVEKFINRKDIKEFLCNIGYEESDSINDYLNTLQKRYELYSCPHELGIFLGIPLQEVIDFMFPSSKKCLAYGYWKVFNDYDFAMKKFKEYDSIKMITAQKIISGMKILNVANEIKYNTQL